MLKNDIVNIFHKISTLSSNERYNIIILGIQKAKVLISQKKSFVFRIIDNTKAGGLHDIFLFINVKKQYAYIHVPNEPNEKGNETNLFFQGIKGGKTPTLLHGIEIIVVSYAIANQSYPKLFFLLNVPHNYNEPEIIIPLIIDPPSTNVLIFHTQIRHINPELLARGWYESMKLDKLLSNDIIRHTILTIPTSTENNYISTNKYKIINKNHAHIIVIPTKSINYTKYFRALHLNRIKRWTSLTMLNESEHPFVKKTLDKTIIHLI